MRIAAHNPVFIFQDQARNFNGYNLEFLKKYAGIIYIAKPWQLHKYTKRLEELGMDPEMYTFVFSVRKLNKIADALVSFNGRPDLRCYAPPKGFKGLKVWHVMDYIFNAPLANTSLTKGGVDYVMGYTDHGQFCPFFGKYYIRYTGRVITVPFGYGKRFKCTVPADERVNKVIALGAVNPVNDPLCKKRIIRDYVDFYKDEIWTHKFRRVLAEKQKDLADVMDSRLPLPPETKNPKYDAVGEVNKYAFFVNDEGLMNFPPARTYEAIACGCVMVASDNEIYTRLGFTDGENYVAFKKNDLNDFREKATYYTENPELMVEMHKKSLLLAEKYSHERIADQLFEDIVERM